MTEQRIPSGVPTGGQFAATPHAETDVRLEVEFAVDEAEQAALALANHETVLTLDQASPAGRLALRANAEARRQVADLRTYLATRRFASRAFGVAEIRALGDALEFHRARIADTARTRGDRASRTALVATDAALFRVDTAMTEDER